MAHLIDPTITPKEDLVQSLKNEAKNILGADVLFFLTSDLKSLVLDSLLVCRVFSGTHYFTGKRDENNGRITLPLSQIFSDYSFALAPAYKLFEGYIYLVAVTMKIVTTDQLSRHISIGSITNLASASKEYKRMLENIAEAIEDQKLLSRWQALYCDYEDFRNAPAHYSGQIRSKYEEVDTEIGHILVEIKNMTRYLFSSDLINKNDRINATVPTVSKIVLYEEPDYEPDMNL